MDNCFDNVSVVFMQRCQTPSASSFSRALVSRRYVFLYTQECEQSQFQSFMRLRGTNHESDGSLLFYVDGDVGALDPGVGAQMSQPYVRVSGR